MVPGAPLHPNHAVIYETAVLLEPASILEVGAGGGDHLANLLLLQPQAKIQGVEISAEQVAVARQRNGDNVADRIGIRDYTVAGVGSEFSAELVFTQAVAMHIHGARYRRLLENLWQSTERWLLLVENWLRHDFVADLSRFGTPQLVHRGRARAVLVSKNEVDRRFVPLRTDRELRSD